MKAQKTIYETKGYKSGCPSYNPCPICYGCRAHSTLYMMCRRCEKNWKKNICDRSKHRDDLLEKMISREKIKIRGG